MKKILLFVVLISCQFISKAQSANKQDMEALMARVKEQQNSKGTVSFSFNGTSVTDAASMMKTKNKIIIGSNITKATSNNQLHVMINKIANGKQLLEKDSKSSSIALINGKSYVVAGEILVSVKGQLIDATLNGSLYEINNKKIKPDAVSSGSIKATFKNINITNY